MRPGFRTLGNAVVRTMATACLVVALFCAAAPGVRAAAYTVETVPNVHLADRESYVSDPDGILSSADVAAINQMARDLQHQTGIELAVVALRDIGDNDAREFATDLFRHWGIGEKGKDSGLLIQLVTDPPQRSVVFETGYGLEGVLPDAIAYRIQQRFMIPDLKNGNYSAGMVKGVGAVRDYLLASDYERTAMVAGPEEEEISALTMLGLFLLPLILLAVFGVWGRRPKKCPRCGHRTYSYAGRELITRPTSTTDGLAVDIYRCSNCGYTNRQNRRLSRVGRDAAIGGILGGMAGGGFRGGRGGGFGGGSWGGGASGGGGSISRF